MTEVHITEAGTFVYVRVGSQHVLLRVADVVISGRAGSLIGHVASGGEDVPGFAVGDRVQCRWNDETEAWNLVRN